MTDPYTAPGLTPGHLGAPVLEPEGTAGHERGVLAEAVAGASGGCEADPFDRVEDDETEDGRGQLGVLGLGQLLNRCFQEEARKVSAGGFRGFFDDFP